MSSERSVKDLSGPYKDWLAVDAVPCELFSGPNSLLTGKNTGNSASLVAATW